jgi:DNA-binding response OmpR family regulator
MSFRILIVEDEMEAAQMLGFYLKQAQFEVSISGDGWQALETFKQAKPHLVILDVALPGLDGLELCRRFRQNSNLPILMLTARSLDSDKAIALGIGADDYLTKPFSPIELMARVKALLRRAYQYSEPPKSAELGKSGLVLDPVRHKVTLDRQNLELTVTEFNILEILMRNPGWVFSRSHLLELLFNPVNPVGEETITAHLSNLRRKLGNTNFIRTVRGVGYTYEEENQ